MNEEIRICIEKYSTQIQDMFVHLRQLIFESAPCEVREELWAKLPSFYANGSFIRLIPFKDHINIEAVAILDHKGDLEGYKITPKGMLQIYIGQDLPCDLLKNIFRETLGF